MHCMYESDGNIVGEDTYCSTVEELKDKNGMVICCPDIFSKGFNLDDYEVYCRYSAEILSESWDDFIEEHGEQEMKRIIKLAKRRAWESDTDLYMAINGDGVGVAMLVKLHGDIVEIDPGYVGGESERSSPTFWCASSGMPEINRMIDEIIKSCKHISKKKNASRNRSN